MNLNASPDTIRAIAQVFKLTAILDDRAAQPDEARVKAWAEQVERHKLIESDLLDGLQAYYDGPSERAMQIGDLIHHAKIARQVRVGSETRAEREAREDRRDAELASIGAAKNETHAIASGVVFGPVPRTDRLAAAEDSLYTCVDRKTAMAAIREYHAAKREARKEAAQSRR